MRKKVAVFFIVFFLFGFVIFSSLEADLDIISTTENMNVLAEENSFSEIICLSGDMTNLENLNIIINSSDTIFVSWEWSIYDDNSGSSDQILMQKIAPNGTLIGSKQLIVSRSDTTEATIALGCSVPLIDSEDNIHLFWYVMDYNNPQMGFVYYKKLSSSLDTLVDSKMLTNVTQSGIGSSIFGEKIPSVIIDSDNFLHLLCCDFLYFYLDSEGNIIDSHNFEIDDIGDGSSLEIDNLGNIFIASEKGYDYIYLQHLESNSSGIFLLNIATILYEDDVLLSEPYLTFIEGNLYISWYADHQKTCKKIDYYGSILEENMMGFNNPGYNFLSRNKSFVTNIELSGRHYNQDNVTFEHSFYTIEGILLVEPKEILKISYDPNNFYGPDVFDLGCVEDSTGYFWLAWIVNDGTNDYQILLWKTDYVGNYQIPVTCCAPSYFEYEFSACLTPLVSEYRNIVGVVSLFVVIVVVSLLRLVSKIVIRKRR
ncbi:MAG: hypothetical protein ACTSQF_04695 [Candidatus Heimdallarchaeaceae archaeon]